MLAKANRLVRADDYKRLVRRGRRTTSANTVVYLVKSPVESPVRFGFIVSKAVGIAVVRNLVRRRLKSLGNELLPVLHPGTDIVIRALPGAAQAGWATLRSEIFEAVAGGERR